MADYLLKTEPTAYSFADLQRDKQTEWDGVHNPIALRNLAAMKPGDRLIIYETGENKSAVGTATVVSCDASDAKNPKMELKAGKPLGKPVTLAQIKANKLFVDSPLVRQGRLSVVPLTAAQYSTLPSWITISIFRVSLMFLSGCPATKSSVARRPACKLPHSFSAFMI